MEPYQKLFFEIIKIKMFNFIFFKNIIINFFVIFLNTNFLGNEKDDKFFSNYNNVIT